MAKGKRPVVKPLCYSFTEEELRDKSATEIKLLVLDKRAQAMARREKNAVHRRRPRSDR
jgi:hypothetical protein